MTKGIDISVWQGNIDFTKLPKDIDFIVIRSSYGTGYVDDKFQRNRDEARKANKAIGYYHYAYPTYNTPEAEAEWFYNVVKDIKSGEFLVLDFEEKYNEPVDWCKKFLDKLSSLCSGYKPLIYLNKFTIDSYDWSPVVKAGYGLWLAYWDYNPDKEAPRTDWDLVAMRQYTNNESVSGISGRVDANVFYGDIETLKKYGVQVGPSCADLLEQAKRDLKAKDEIITLKNREIATLDRALADCRIDVEMLQNELKKLKDAIGNNKSPLSDYSMGELLKELLIRFKFIKG